jgi:hypothetical protein
VSGHLWTPGAAGPLDELVGRISRLVTSFTSEHGLEQAEVRLELGDGSRVDVQTLTAEPGFGFFSIIPHGEGEKRCLIVPVGFVRSIEISPPDPERQFGFVVSD